jgi:flagellar hook-associated protein 2
MVDDSSGAITFNGLSTGLQSGEIVEQLVKVARQPIRQLEKRSAIVEAHRDAYNSVIGVLKDLSSTVEKMDELSDLQGVNASVSNAAFLNVSASNNAQLGSHTVKVQQLAASQQTFSNSQASASQTGLFGIGSLTVTLTSGASQNFSIDGTTTLSSLQQQISNGTLGLYASVINEGSTARLALQSGQSGVANGFTVQEFGTTLGLAVAGNTPQAAADSRFLLDNTSQITRPSNTVNDVLSGVSLQLAQVDPGQQTITLTGSSSNASDALKTFVDKYNAVLSMVFAITRPDLASAEGKEEKATKAAENQMRMPGDATLRMLLNNMQGVISSNIPGADPSATSLASLGVTTNDAGLLQIDSTQVQAKLTAAPGSIAKLFARTFGAQGGPGIADRLLSVTESAQQTGGPLKTGIQSMDDAVRRFASEVANKERNLAVYEQNLKNQFAQLETLMSKLKSQGDYLSSFGSQGKK